jgi:hypothetical protein
VQTADAIAFTIINPDLTLSSKDGINNTSAWFPNPSGHAFAEETGRQKRWSDIL